MSLWTWIFLGALVLLVFELWPRGRAVFRLSDHGGIAAVLKRFYAHGRDDATLMIETDSLEHCLVFRKRILADGEVRLRMELVLEGWSEKHFKRLHEELSVRGVVARQEVTSNGMSLLSADFGSDLTSARRIALLAFDSVFQVPLATRRAYFAKMSTVTAPSITGNTMPIE